MNGVPDRPMHGSLKGGMNGFNSVSIFEGRRYPYENRASLRARATAQHPKGGFIMPRLEPLWGEVPGRAKQELRLRGKYGAQTQTLLYGAGILLIFFI